MSLVFFRRDHRVVLVVAAVLLLSLQGLGAQARRRTAESLPEPGASGPPIESAVEPEDEAPQPPSIYDSAEYRYDDNYFGVDQDTKKRFLDRIQWRLSLWTNFNYFNDADLRKKNDANETSVEETDDRMYFGVLGAEIAFFLPVNRYLDVRLDLWRAGFWGHDQLAGTDANNDNRRTSSGANTLNFGQVYLDIHLRPDPTRESRLDLAIGRQHYGIGGAIYRDYLFDDTLDSIVFSWYGWLGRLDVLVLDVYANGVDTSDVNFVQYLSFDSEKVEGFDGDVNTYRQGLIYRLPIIGDFDLGGTHVETRAFYHYARLGALDDGGNDRTNEGTVGNQADRDFVFLRGLRINAGYKEWIRMAFTFADSYGIDRKATDQLLLPSQDVDNNGRAYSLEADSSLFERVLILRASYFFSEGGRYHLNGQQYSHGFVGFKGAQVGGILANMNWGLHPSAYVDDDGIDDTPYDRDRKTGSEVKHLGFKVGMPGFLYFFADWWRIEDTNHIGIFGQGRRKPFAGMFTNQDPVNSLEQQLLLGLAQQVFPADTAVLAASRRFGAPLGEEINLGIEWQVMHNWTVWATVGAFRPMRYFSTPGLVALAPQGNTRFVGAQIGMKLVL